MVKESGGQVWRVSLSRKQVTLLHWQAGTSLSVSQKRNITNMFVLFTDHYGKKRIESLIYSNSFLSSAF